MFKRKPLSLYANPHKEYLRRQKWKSIRESALYGSLVFVTVGSALASVYLAYLIIDNWMSK